MGAYACMCVRACVRACLRVCLSTSRVASAVKIELCVI